MKLPLIIIMVIVAMALGAGGTMIFVKSPKAVGASSPKNHIVLETENLPLDERTVNLADRSQAHYLRTTIVVEVSGKGTIEELAKTRMPQLMDRTIEILSKQYYAELSTQGGKQALKKLLIEGYQEELDEEGWIVHDVLFTDFVME